MKQNDPSCQKYGKFSDILRRVADEIFNDAPKGEKFFENKMEAQWYLDLIRQEAEKYLKLDWPVDAIREHTGISKNRLEDLLNELSAKYHNNQEMWRKITKTYLDYGIPRRFFYVNLSDSEIDEIAGKEISRIEPPEIPFRLGYELNKKEYEALNIVGDEPS